MRVAITGGLGFIGNHLAEAFDRLGESVTFVDDGSGRVEGAVDGAQGVGDDAHIIDAGTWARDMQFLQWQGMPDLVVHCAAPVGPGLVAGRGGRIATEIIRVTSDVGYACARHGIPLVNISSSEVYGVPGVGLEGSELQPVGHVGPFSARSEYGLAKALAENVLANIEGLEHCNVRPFNTAGPRQSASKGFVLPTFIEQAKRHEPLTVYEPKARRSLTSVHDLVRFIVAYWTEAVAQGGAWNVGSMDNDISIGELAQLVCNTHIAATGSDAKWIEADPVDRWGDAYSFFGRKNGEKLPDSTKAMSLGWQPTWSLADIVRDAYERTEL